MDIIKIARLVEELSNCKHRANYKNYRIREAVADGVISEDDANKLRAEYTADWMCENPYSHKFTAVYYGALFEGDVPYEYNEYGFDEPSGGAWDWIHMYGEDFEVEVHDNEYGLTYNTAYKEWS